MDRVFRSGRLLVMSAAILALTITMIFFYDKALLRYGINLVILAVLFLKRDLIKETMAKMRSAKKKK